MLRRDCPQDWRATKILMLRFGNCVIMPSVNCVGSSKGGIGDNMYVPLFAGNKKMDLKTLKAGFFGGLIAYSVFCILVYPNAFCAEAVSVKDGLLSVNITDTSLLEVARAIEKRSGVWFRGDETLFQEKISVTFNDLPLEEGLKRVLTNLSFSLMFDNEHKVTGVMVMGESKSAEPQPSRPGVPPQRVVTPPGARTQPPPTARIRPSTALPPEAVRRPPRVIPQPAQARVAPQPPSSGSAQSATPEASRVQENSPSPGATAPSDGPLPPTFRATENAPQPGGTQKESTGSPGDSKPPTQAPSPGDGNKGDTTP
jgi:hypothetical protein